jgi:DNA-formamidopyrimidine glycosylase
MPEGHTLYRLARELTDAFAGGPVRASSPQGRFAADAAVIDGTELVGAESGGKHLFVEFAGDRFVHVHLGLIGKWDVRPGPAPEPIGAVRLRLENASRYADLRGAIICDLVGRDRRDAVLGRIGPDPLRPDADPEIAWRRIQRSDRVIGDLIMDQEVLAGVGNVFRAEVLFRHRIDPLRPGRTLRRSQWQAIWDDLVGLLADGVRTGRIDTVRAEHTPEAMGRAPRKDDHGGEVYVYRRTGQPCHVCGTAIRTKELKGRNLFWCPRCQPRFRSRAKVSSR